MMAEEHVGNEYPITEEHYLELKKLADSDPSCREKFKKMEQQGFSFIPSDDPLALYYDYSIMFAYPDISDVRKALIKTEQGPGLFIQDYVLVTAKKEKLNTENVMKFSQLKVGGAFIPTIPQVSNDGKLLVWKKKSETEVEGTHEFVKLMVVGDPDVIDFSDVGQAMLCAEGMDFDVRIVDNNEPEHTVRFVTKPEGFLFCSEESYWPFKNDAQAMALAKRFMLQVNHFAGSAELGYATDKQIRVFDDENINSAIVGCVASYVVMDRYLNKLTKSA